MIPYGRQDITAEDIEAVREVLESDWLTQGPRVTDFERSLATKVGARHALAVNSATSALHIACLALELGPGDLLWTTPNTFVASANCARYCGADIDFVDIDSRTYNLSAGALERKLDEAKRVGRIPKVLVVVHHSGQPCEMETISKLTSKHGIKIIEDASHAVGAKYKDEYVGNCRYSDIVVFSFHPVKVITTGEGGAALTNDDATASRMAMLRSHGITRDAERMEGESEGPWYYEQVELGFNYRITDIQAALGLSQLARLDSYVQRRQELSVRYDELLADIPVITPWQHPDGCSARHLYVVRIGSEVEVSRKKVFAYLRDSGIGVNVHYIPVHIQPYYQRLGFTIGDFPEAEQYYREALSLPLFPALTEKQQDAVIDALRLAVIR